MTDAALSFVIVSVLFWFAVSAGIYLKSWRYWIFFAFSIAYLAAHTDPHTHSLSEMSEADVAWLWGCNALMGIIVYQIRGLRHSKRIMAFLKRADDLWVRRNRGQNTFARLSGRHGSTGKSRISGPIA